MALSQLDESNRCEYAIRDALKAEVMVKFVPTGEYAEGQLTLNVGDILWVLEQHGDWWGGHKDGDDQTGWFPGGICQILSRGDLQEESFCDDGNSALQTSDGRVVASPQAKGRNQALAAAQLEVADTKAALEAERHRAQHQEEQLKAYKNEQQDWAQERQHWARKAEDWENKANRYRDDSRSKEAELAKQREALQAALQAAEAKLRDEKSQMRSLQEKMSQLQEHCRTVELQAQAAQHAKQAAQQALEAVMEERSRGFTRPAPENSGNRTPSAPHTVPSLATLSGPGSLQAPVGTYAAPTSVQTVAHLPLSARQGALASTRHPSPRHGSASWMPVASGVGPPPSPHMRQRILSQRDMALETGPQAPVRTLVSEFERRSNSQGAPMTREPLPTNRQLLFATGTAPTSTSATSCTSIRRPMVMSSGSSLPISSATIRAGSREALPLRPAVPSSSRSFYDADPDASPSARGEDTPKNLNFGMSPIKRSAYPIPRGGHPTVVPAMSYSPPSRTTISVQERVRQLQQGR